MEILTANELISGATVYLDSEGNWQPEIDQARLFGPHDLAARDAVIERSKQTGRLISLEVEVVEVVDGHVVAQRLRERIRAAGPTAPYGPGRQQLGEDGHVSL